ncbi:MULTISPECIES: hypothetical protein [Chromobacterium]|nr:MULTISPECIES: hypothetical protein [Chromobacterium]MDE1714774.1 hypothetical protein [Chromobacterium amazonense]
MSMEITDMTDDAAKHLREGGWIIKAPYFRNGQPVFLVIKLPG